MAYNIIPLFTLISSAITLAKHFVNLLYQTSCIRYRILINNDIDDIGDLIPPSKEKENEEFDVFFL